MKMLRIAAAAVVAMGLCVGALPAAAQMDPIKDRQDLMKSNGGALGVINGFLKDNRGSAADVAAAARRVAANGEKIPSLFPAGSTVGTTRALPAIWEKRADFERLAGVLKQKAEALATAADGGDKAKIQTALSEMGRDACGACHNGYRAAARN